MGTWGSHSADSTMQLLKNIHSIIDYALALLKLVQNREVGWRTLNRKTGKYEREQQPLFKKLKLLLLFNPITEWIDRTHLLRLWIHEKTIAAGQKEASKASAHQIKGFVDFYHINMVEIDEAFDLMRRGFGGLLLPCSDCLFVYP